jgi:hypothetical protein
MADTNLQAESADSKSRNVLQFPTAARSGFTIGYPDKVMEVCEAGAAVRRRVIMTWVNEARTPEERHDRRELAFGIILAAEMASAMAQSSAAHQLNTTRKRRA